MAVNVFIHTNKPTLTLLRQDKNIESREQELSFVFESDMLEMKKTTDYSFYFISNKTLFSVEMFFYHEDEEQHQVFWTVKVNNKNKSNATLLKSREIFDFINDSNIDEIIYDLADFILEKIVKILKSGVEL